MVAPPGPATLPARIRAWMRARLRAVDALGEQLVEADAGVGLRRRSARSAVRFVNRCPCHGLRTGLRTTSATTEEGECRRRSDDCSQATAAGDRPSAADARLQRNLKIVVVALAVLIFAGLATIVGRVIYLASGAPTQPAAPGLAIAAGAEPAPAGRGAGAVRLAVGQPVSGTLRGGRRRGHRGSRSADRAADHVGRHQARAPVN